MAESGLTQRPAEPPIVGSNPTLGSSDRVKRGRRAIRLRFEPCDERSEVTPVQIRPLASFDFFPSVVATATVSRRQSCHNAAITDSYPRQPAVSTFGHHSKTVSYSFDSHVRVMGHWRFRLRFLYDIDARNVLTTGDSHPSLVRSRQRGLDLCLPRSAARWDLATSGGFCLLWCLHTYCLRIPST